MTNQTVVAEVTKPTVRNFKAAADVENFYRFVHENGLRDEATKILKAIHGVIGEKPKRKRRGRKKLQ